MAPSPLQHTEGDWKKSAVHVSLYVECGCPFTPHRSQNTLSSLPYAVHCVMSDLCPLPSHLATEKNDWPKIKVHVVIFRKNMFGEIVPGWWYSCIIWPVRAEREGTQEISARSQKSFKAGTVYVTKCTSLILLFSIFICTIAAPCHFCNVFCLQIPFPGASWLNPLCFIFLVQFISFNNICL